MNLESIPEPILSSAISQYLRDPRISGLISRILELQASGQYPDPDDVAVGLYDALPEEVGADDVADVCGTPRILGIICQQIPDLNEPSRKWLERVRESMLEIARSDIEDAGSGDEEEGAEDGSA